MHEVLRCLGFRVWGMGYVAYLYGLRDCCFSAGGLTWPPPLCPPTPSQVRSLCGKMSSGSVRFDLHEELFEF